MRIACLQFNPQPGKVAQNIVKAEALLESIPPHSLDLLVLPEMALTGADPNGARLPLHLCMLRSRGV